MMPHQRSRRTSGNALIFILIAIFLLGGLTAMLARSGGNTDDTGATEKDAVVASELLSYLSSMQSGVNRLIQSGCSENQLSFWNDSNGDGTEDASDLYYNANSPTDRSCHVFRPEGVGLNQKDLSKYITYTTNTTRGWSSVATYYLGAQVTGQMTLQGVGPDDNKTDLLFIFPINKKSICEQINRILGVGMNGTAFYVDGGYFEQNKFIGAYTRYDAGAIIGNESSNYYRGRKAACYQDGAAFIVFYYTLLAR